MGSLKSSFSRRTRILWFYSKILGDKYIWSSRLRYLFLESFGDKTNAKLFLQAEYVILCRAFQKKNILRVYSSKNTKIQHFHSKILLLSQNAGFSRFLSCTPVVSPFSEKARHKITYSACKNSFALVSSPTPPNNKFRSRLDHLFFFS